MVGVQYLLYVGKRWKMVNPKDNEKNSIRKYPDPKRWAIKNIKGEVLAYHCRVDLENGKKKMWWQPPVYGDETKIKTVTLPLYGAHLLPKKWVGTPIVLVEGEKAADALLQWGTPALGTVCGAHTIPADDILSVLNYREVIFFPDNDEQGYKHFVKIANKLRNKIRPRLFLWKGFKGADAVDWLQFVRPRHPYKILQRSPAWYPPEPKQERRREYTIIPEDNTNIKLDDVVSRVVQLKQGSSNTLVGPCPFHDENDPSFTVYLQKNNAYCFGCGIYINNPVDFVMKYYNLPYKNAIERLQNGT